MTDHARPEAATRAPSQPPRNTPEGVSALVQRANEMRASTDDVLQERATAASLAIARCRSDCEFDLIPYYEGQRDAYLDAKTELARISSQFEESASLVAGLSADVTRLEQEAFNRGVEAGEIGADQNWHAGYNKGYAAAEVRVKELEQQANTPDGTVNGEVADSTKNVEIRALVEGALWVAAIDDVGISERIEAVARWLRTVDDLDLWRITRDSSQSDERADPASGVPGRDSTATVSAANYAARSRDDAEMWCDRCHVRHGVVWFAPSDVWNATMRDGDGGNPDRYGFCCPLCFIQLAEEAGVKTTGWLVTPEGHAVGGDAL